MNRYILTNGCMILKTDKDYRVMADDKGERLENETAREYAGWLAFRMPEQIGLIVLDVCDSLQKAVAAAYRHRYSK